MVLAMFDVGFYPVHLCDTGAGAQRSGTSPHTSARQCRLDGHIGARVSQGRSHSVRFASFCLHRMKRPPDAARRDKPPMLVRLCRYSSALNSTAEIGYNHHIRNAMELFHKGCVALLERLLILSVRSASRFACSGAIVAALERNPDRLETLLWYGSVLFDAGVVRCSSCLLCRQALRSSCLAWWQVSGRVGAMDSPCLKRPQQPSGVCLCKIMTISKRCWQLLKLSITFLP